MIRIEGLFNYAELIDSFAIKLESDKVRKNTRQDYDFDEPGEHYFHGGHHREIQGKTKWETIWCSPSKKLLDLVGPLLFKGIGGAQLTIWADGRAWLVVTDGVHIANVGVEIRPDSIPERVRPFVDDHAHQSAVKSGAKHIVVWDD